MEPDDLLPGRSWEELIAVSTRRGRVLRRRRRAAMATPPLAAVAALTTGITLLTGGSGSESLRPLPADSPTPSVTRLHLPPSRPNVERSVSGAEGVALGPSGPATPTPSLSLRPLAGQGRLPAPTRLSFHSATTVFGDERGDGAPSGVGIIDPALPGGSTRAASNDAVDILRMTFEARSEGLTITMRLAGPHRDDAYYLAHLTDASTGCELEVWLGGPQPDGFFDGCAAESRFVFTPPVVDPDESTLQATVPWSMLPKRVDPRHAFSDLDGLTRVQSAGGASTPIDEAVTSQKLGPVWS